MPSDPTDDELRALKRKRERALYELAVTEWGGDDLLSILAERYAPSVIPPCRVCGAKMAIAAVGGGQATVWACSGQEDDPERPGRLRRQAGRSAADAHYAQSRYRDTRQGGDKVVMELIRRVRALRVQL